MANILQMVPSFTTFNIVAGMWITGWIVYAMWKSNVWNFGYLPVNANTVFDHFGQLYNVSNAVNANGVFDETKYQAYSAPYLSSGYVILTGGFLLRTRPSSLMSSSTIGMS